MNAVKDFIPLVEIVKVAPHSSTSPLPHRCPPPTPLTHANAFAQVRVLLAGDEEDAIDQLQADSTHALPNAAGGDKMADPAPASTADNIGPGKNGILKETVLGSRFGGGSTGAAVNRHLSRKPSAVDDVPRTVSPSLVSIFF